MESFASPFSYRVPQIPESNVAGSQQQSVVGGLQGHKTSSITASPPINPPPSAPKIGGGGGLEAGRFLDPPPLPVTSPLTRSSPSTAVCSTDSEMSAPRGCSWRRGRRLRCSFRGSSTSGAPWRLGMAAGWGRGGSGTSLSRRSLALIRFPSAILGWAEGLNSGGGINER